MGRRAVTRDPGVQRKWDTQGKFHRCQVDGEGSFLNIFTGRHEENRYAEVSYQPHMGGLPIWQSAVFIDL